METEKRLIFVSQGELKPGVNFLDEGRIIVYKDATGKMMATRNRCKHQGGSFHKTSDCALTCSRHGWRLDTSTMTYLAPTGKINQEQLIAEVTSDGKIQLFEPLYELPWRGQFKKKPLKSNEFTLCFFAHACAEIKLGERTLFTDPWLVGPAFTRGWWLVHEPPSDWLDRLACADAIYISHNHSDHLNFPTLSLLATKNPYVPVFVPAFKRDSCKVWVRKAGMRNIQVTPFNRWIELDSHGRFMILQDATGRDDSGILIDYKGYRILNNVDCSNLCNGILPLVDVLLSSFAGGASGYPVCWTKLYPVDQINRIVTNNRSSLLQQLLNIVTISKPRIFIPFAGYFIEAHPSDMETKLLNKKNTPEEACELIKKYYPDIATLILEPGGILDIGMCQINPSKQQQVIKTEYDFEKYLTNIKRSQMFQPLRDQDGIKKYFSWAGFSGDLVLHIIETDELFAHVVREYYVDFRDLSVVDRPPDPPYRYLQMKVRSDVFRFVLQRGLPWEEISIGFQARFYREPDVYNFDFWDHFQNNLPEQTPW